MRKRLFLSIFIIFAFSASTFARLSLIALFSGPSFYERALSQQSSSVIYYTSRAVITDRHGVPLTDTESSVLGVIDTLVYEGGALFDSKYESYFESAVASHATAIIPLKARQENIKGLWCLETLTRYSKDQLAVHLIGSLNGNGDGESGLEYAFNSFLRKNEKKYSVSYSSDSAGGIISGLGINITGNAEPSRDSLILTIDSDIQKIAENAAMQIESGAVIVARVQTGEIVAAVSRPSYHPYDIGAALEKEGALTNKCLMPFNAGSAFKLVTLAAFLESGGSEFNYNCGGSIEVGNSEIGCYLRKHHGELDVASALCVSCNGFFIKMGLLNGAEKMLETAKALGFGASSELASGYFSSQGSLASKSELGFDAELANMSMGQGRLLVTPVQMAQMTQIIANGGVKAPLCVAVGTVENGVFQKDRCFDAEKERVLSPNTAQTICDLMETVSESGTGKKANPFCGSGTKTSTAETGIMNESGKYTVQSWITGFFPKDAPRYVITVLAENADPKISSSSPVFKEISENIARLENIS
ncbi:MAG: penicillin-binding protein 2 [Clostridia bacterium]|nr:penicillin-binding protein 2 [Clostridia bacterium]